MKPEYYSCTKSFDLLSINVAPQPNRIYFLEDPEGNALKWCAQIEDVSRHYFDSS